MSFVCQLISYRTKSSRKNCERITQGGGLIGWLILATRELRESYEYSTIRSRQTFFSERVINVWNYLQYDIVCFNSLNAFKRSIVRVDFKSFLQRY